MTRNIGALDRALRIIVEFVLLAHPTAWGWLALIPIATAFAGFCPAYRLLGQHLRTGLTISDKVTDAAPIPCLSSAT